MIQLPDECVLDAHQCWSSFSMRVETCWLVSLQVAANNIRLVVPHLSWAAQPSSSFQAQQQQEPLQFLADALSVCSDQELHPTEALALLLSAASVPTAAARGASSHQSLVQAGSSGRSMSGAAAAALEGQVRAACTHTAPACCIMQSACDDVTGQDNASLWLDSSPRKGRVLAPCLWRCTTDGALRCT